MNKTSKIALGTMLSIALTSSVWAQGMDIFDRGAFWITGNYTQSSNNGASYAMIVQSPAEIDDGEGLGFDGENRHAFVGGNLEFDYALGFSYHIACTQTRVFVSYDHFTDSNDSTNVNIVDIGFAPSSSAFGHVRNHADEVRIGLIHALDFTPRFHVDVASFLEWDGVKRDIQERVLNAAGTIRYRDTYNRVQGWGPGLGGRVRAYPFNCYSNLGFFMGLNTILLLGDNVFDTALWEESTLFYHYDPEHTHSLIGKIDISLGFDYTACIPDIVSDMVVNIALGVRYMNMFNVFKNGNAYENPVYFDSNDNVHYAPNLGYPNDWGRVGPFLTFAIGGARA